MPKKKDASFVCPKCGRDCIQPVEIWKSDFLAIHRVIKKEVKSRYGREPWFMKIIADKCDSMGNTSLGEVHEGGLF